MVSIMDADPLMMAHIVDGVCLAVALVLPVLIVLRWNLRGIVAGTFIFWGSLTIAGILISRLNPHRLEGGTAMLDTIWFLGGWVAGFLYCFLIFGSKRLVFCFIGPCTAESKRRSLPPSLWMLLAFVLVCFGCRDKPDGKQTPAEFAAAIRSYPYEAPQTRKNTIVKNFPRLEVGMPKEQVAELIGDPDYSELSYGPKGPFPRWLGWWWIYWLRKRDSGVNVFDPCVNISFDTDGRAKWIAPSNVAGLTEKGTYLRKSSTADLAVAWGRLSQQPQS